MRGTKARKLRQLAHYKVGKDKTVKTFEVDNKGFLVITNPEYRLYKELKRNNKHG